MLLRVLLLGLAALAAAQARPHTVAARMHNVVFHLGYGVELSLMDLSGRLAATKPDGWPVFDDVESYVVEIDTARTAMTPGSLTNLMNKYVFTAPDAPLHDLTITIEGTELKQTGKIRKGVDVPFTMKGTVGATSDGKIRIHPTSIKAAGFVPKGVLDFFGLELDRLVKLKRTPAVKIDGDDLLLDPERLLPPPQIRGHVTRVWIENGLIMQQFGSATAAPALTPPRSVANYQYYRGGMLKFGKLTMEDADLLLVDANPRNPFEFAPADYNRQLVAGYSKNTPNHG